MYVLHRTLLLEGATEVKQEGDWGSSLTNNNTNLQALKLIVISSLTGAC